MSDETVSTTCCVVGGGPAGIMLGYLLARQSVQVTVLEKHKDFFRDFRGDTVHPSTLELFYQLGLLDDFLALPHQKVRSVNGVFGDFRFTAASFKHVPTHCKFVALMPQWDFLNFLFSRAKESPYFDLRMQHEAIDLTRSGARITGVKVLTPSGSLTVEADLVVACDGRHSTMRTAAQLDVKEFGVPIDVLWFRISRRKSDPEDLFGNINYGRALILIDRADYFQGGLIIRKGSFSEIQSQGMESFHQTILKIAPYLGERVQELRDWDQIKLLTVQINRLKKWYLPGLLCIGDAAHAMSPAGGVGINIAIQDGVAVANLVGAALRERCVDERILAMVQQRREFPVRVTQFFQVNAHRAFARIFENPGPLHAPWQLKVAVRVPGVQRAVGRMIGIGVRPEHIGSVPRRPLSRPKLLRAVACAAGAMIGFAVVTLSRRQRTRLAAS